MRVTSFCVRNFHIVVLEDVHQLIFERVDVLSHLVVVIVIVTLNQIKVHLTSCSYDIRNPLLKIYSNQCWFFFACMILVWDFLKTQPNQSTSYFLYVVFCYACVFRFPLLIGDISGEVMFRKIQQGRFLSRKKATFMTLSALKYCKGFFK